MLNFNALQLIAIIISFQEVLVLKEIIYLLYMTINIIIAISINSNNKLLINILFFL